MSARWIIVPGLCGLLGLALAGLPALGRGAPEAAPEVTPEKSGDVGELSWMAGRWRGDLFGGPIEERWDRPVGGVMLGVARLGEAREKALYEFMMIEEKDGRLTMFIRHFKHRLKSLDVEPVEFALVESSKHKAVFEHPNPEQNVSRITYERTAKDRMQVTLDGRRGGHPQTHKTGLRRAGK